MFFWFLLSLIIYHYFFGIPDHFKFDCSIFNDINPFTRLIGIIIAFLTGLIVSRFTFYKNKQLEHKTALERLKLEIEKNHEKMGLFLADFKSTIIKWESDDAPHWIPNKVPSFGFSNNVYQYFSCSAFTAFMNRNHHLDINDIRKISIIMEMYAASINLSVKSQEIEEKINSMKHASSTNLSVKSQEREAKNNLKENQELDFIVSSSDATASATSSFNRGIKSSADNNLHQKAPEFLQFMFKDDVRSIERLYQDSQQKFYQNFKQIDESFWRSLEIVYWWQWL